MTFTALGHLPEMPHFLFIAICHISFCRIVVNFLQIFFVQYRTEFPIEFTLPAIHVALTFPGITHMMNYLDFLWYFKPQTFLIFSDTPYDAMQMTFHAHVLNAVLMWFWDVACVLNGHALYTIFPTPHFLALYTMYINTSTYKVS